PGLRLRAVLLDAENKPVAEVNEPVSERHHHFTFPSLPDITLWDIDHPYLYTLETSLYNEENVVDQTATRFGFRETEFRKDGGFYLNDRRVQLFGLNRHQTYPYLGAAAPARLQRQDADTLKFDLACNVVRTSHYPQSPHFLNRCDEIGLLVFEEITGWQHIGDDAWKAIVVEELEAMIERDRNHPSIIIWGVRVNESPDDDEFYTRTNALAHQLDPGRQTGGVRCFLGSSFLEDVYTYNDFSNTVVDPPHKPYLITEFAGHMFPTKVWDGEDRLIEHALLHARIQNLQMGRSDISGAIGWCAFDYGTHIEFGSGDRICYHGVMDIFRLPKWAAYFYQSQLPPQQKVVLQAATHWTMGDRSGGGNNPLTVFSNCDEVEVIIGDINVGKFKPDRENYPHLKHPPFVIFGLNEFSAWGQRRFYDLQLVGYVDGKAVAEQKIAANQLPDQLLLKTSTQQIYADGADMAQVSFFITDRFGNTLPFAKSAIHLEVEGEAELIGENPFLMFGGQGAVYIKAGKQSGSVTVTARADGLAEKTISIDIVKQNS
ncbi:MAG TPA: glycoside hydrolase family 2 TIM barrel-domain containing protein, partial [Anaerolineaceae bacterium]|nr:glycoside hydrolase family 2 TIM barrel-domain containing protein [Anaerolineaceae bacterium]